MAYALHMALLALRRSPWLTALIVLAIAVGIASSTTVYTMLRAMSADPIPQKSSRLFVPQIDSIGPSARRDGRLPGMLSWRDVQAFKAQGPATRQAGMYEIAVGVSVPHGTTPPLLVSGRATHGDFFALFDVPLRGGRGWSAAEGEGAAHVVVISEDVADRLFPGRDATGLVLQVEQHDYTVIGVTRHWAPAPRFYDLGGLKGGALAYSKDARIFIPVRTALADRIQGDGAVTCPSYTGADFADFIASNCLWMQFWAELPDATAVRAYRDFLRAYADEQQRSGRFAWKPETALRDVHEWLVWNEFIPDELRVATLTSIGFLFVCLVNAMALMLARSSRSVAEMSLRRAVGASRRALFVQGLSEAALIGIVGGAVGLLLTFAGLGAMRALMPQELVSITEASPPVLVLALVASAVAAVAAGMVPAWQASRTTGIALKST